MCDAQATTTKGRALKQAEEDKIIADLVRPAREIKGEPGNAFGDWITALSILLIIGAIAFHLGWKAAQ